MNSTTKVVSYDYESPCGFSKFPDGSKFKYNGDGEVCLSTDCSTWAKRLLHNLPLPDYIDSEAFVPPCEFLSFPMFGTQERRRKQRRKESVSNYIENCECCGTYMEKTFYIDIEEYKLICESCNQFLQQHNCALCKGRPNKFVERFVKSKTPLDETIAVEEQYCVTCWGNLSQLSNAYFSSGYYDSEEDYYDSD